MKKQRIMRAILIEPGKEPEIVQLPADQGVHEEAIRDILEGNYGAVEFFEMQPGISLFILVNDLAAVLGMKANRRFPAPDQETIIFGKAIFIAAYNGALEGKEGTLDMGTDTCNMFIEQIKLHFSPCTGQEVPSPKENLYYEENEKGEEVPYRWLEINRPVSLSEPIKAGRTSFYRDEKEEYMEINGRFFKKLPVYTSDAELN